MARFMVTAMPFTGQVTPMVAVAEALVARGHDVRMYTGRGFRNAVEAAVTVLPLYLASRQGPPSGMGLTPGSNPVTRARDAALRAAAPLLGRPLQRPVARQRAALGLPPSRETFNDAIFSASLILATGVPALDHGLTDRPARLHWVGALQRRGSAGAPLPGWWSDLNGRSVASSPRAP